jgi:hypothetical protein
MPRMASYSTTTRSPRQELTRIIDFTFRFPMVHGTWLDIGGSMGTVPRQESARAYKLFHAPSGTFKMALLICLIFSARTA